MLQGWSIYWQNAHRSALTFRLSESLSSERRKSGISTFAATQLSTFLQAKVTDCCLKEDRNILGRKNENSALSSVEKSKYEKIGALPHAYAKSDRGLTFWTNVREKCPLSRSSQQPSLKTLAVPRIPYIGSTPIFRFVSRKGITDVKLKQYMESSSKGKIYVCIRNIHLIRLIYFSLLRANTSIYILRCAGLLRPWKSKL